MSVTLDSASAYQGLKLSDLAEALLSVFTCTGIAPNSATYISTPITTGELLIRWHEENRGSSDLSDIRSAVIETNLASVQPLVRHVREVLRDATVVEPVSMLDIPNWAQPDYHSFWCAFVERFAGRVVFNEGWHLSNGCAAEFATAALSGHELLDHNLDPLSVTEGLRLIEASYHRLESVGLDTTLLRRAADAVRAQ